MSNRISLAMIVAPTDEEAAKLDRCLESVYQHVDEVCITITGENKAVEATARKYGANVSHFHWVRDFAKARTFSFEQATGDWVLWLDADDVLYGAEKLRGYADQALDQGVDGFLFLYHYRHDEHGNLIESHWKAQMVKNDGHAEWKGAVHEDLLPKRSVQWVKVSDVVRVHTSTAVETSDHFQRNLEILKIENIANPKEPRTWFYLARTYLGLGQYEKTIECCNEYLKLSGWDQERYEARLIMGEAFTKLGDLKTAILAYSDAAIEYEGAPEAYIYKARVYMQQEEWHDALTNLEIAGSLKKGGQLVENPTLLERDLPVLAASCLIHLNRPTEAYKLAQVAVSRSKDPHAREMLMLAKELASQHHLNQMYQQIGNDLLEKGETEKLTALLKSVPDSIADDPEILELQFAATEPRVWPKKSIAFMCGPSVEAWDANSLKSGIGGSETAVIEIAKRLAADGWEVVVYNRCDAPAEGTVIDGVLYKNYWTIDQRDTFDVLCLWRSPVMLDVPWKARKVVLDLHDVVSDAEFTSKRLANVDHVFVKSKHHATYIPSVPKEKIVVIGNGIDLSRFEGEEERDVNRFVYTSTQNRGLEALLQMWPQIKKEIPKAELHTYYGWESFEKINKDNPERMEWMRHMKQKLNQEGVYDHGRVGQDVLAKELMRSSLWLYPTDFPEIHCITALEMQAAGVIPVTTGYAALEDTQKVGVKLPGDPYDPEWQKQYVEEVVSTFMDSQTDLDIREKGKEFASNSSWDNVSTSWENTLKP